MSMVFAGDLFVAQDGTPMCFNISRCENIEELQDYIEVCVVDDRMPVLVVICSIITSSLFILISAWQHILERVSFNHAFWCHAESHCTSHLDSRLSYSYTETNETLLATLSLIFSDSMGEDWYRRI